MDLSPFIDGLVANSAQNIKQVQGDYIGKDGLLYCGKCFTPKQCRVEFFGEIKTPMCLCKCEVEKREKEEAERKRIEFENRAREMRRNGFPDAEMQHWNFANDDLTNERITRVMQRYVDNFAYLRKQGKGLLLYGNFGTGKTFAACEVANALIDKGYPCHVTNFSRILNTLQGTFEKQEYLDELNRYQLLVIDDLAAERNTEFAKEQVFNIIDARYRAGLPMIITTNLTSEQIKNPQSREDKRVFDRIIERCFPIEVTGQGRRKIAFASDYDGMKDLLGL